VIGRNNEMRKISVNSRPYLLNDILRKILILGWIPLVLVHSSVWGQQTVRVSMTKKGVFNLAYENDSFKPLFKEPSETLVVIFNNGRCLLFSERDVDAVGVSARALSDLFNEMGFRMDDVAIIVHNHLKPAWFSPQDKRFCHQLIWFGFQGKFLVYFPSRNKTIEFNYQKGKLS
jgi:hypothetical protein